MKVLVTVKEVAEVDDEFRISGLDVDDGDLLDGDEYLHGEVSSDTTDVRD